MAPITSNSDSRVIAILFSNCLFIILPPIAVVLRVWARKIKKTSLCFNDYAIFIALILAIGYNVLGVITTTRGGAGQHLGFGPNNAGLKELTITLKVFVAATVIWPLANTAVKLSVLDFYTRIFPNRLFKICVWISTALTLAFCLATILTSLLICRPMAYNWDRTIHGTCGDTTALYLSTGIVNLIIDVGIVSLPMPMLWGLQMKFAKKLALSLIFGLGFFICIISILRVIAISRVDFTDVTYSSVLDEAWSELEPTLGVINACLPILQPVLSKVSSSSIFTRRKTKGSAKNSSSGRRWMLSGSKSAPRRGQSDPRSFERLDDHTYPLKDTYNIQNEAAGPSGKNSDLDDDVMLRYGTKESSRGINVKGDWNVHSNPPT